MTDFGFFELLLIVGLVWMIRETFGSKARREWRGFARRQRREGPYRSVLRRERERLQREQSKDTG